MPLRWALLILWAACSSGARDGVDELRSPSVAANPRSLSAAANKEKRTRLDEDQCRVAELRSAGYDPKVAARMMWWSTKAAYFKFKLEDRKIGLKHLRGKVRLASNSEVAVLRDDQDGSHAYVIFRGSQEPVDWLRNLEILTVEYAPEAIKWGTGWYDAFVSMLRPLTPRLHRGFARRSNDHFAAMLLALAKLFNNDLSKIKRLTFSGHSLGGAVAQATAFRLKGWLIRACSSGQDNEEWKIPPGPGMRRALSIQKFANSTLIFDGHKPVKCFKNKSVDIDVYTFSAPRLGNWQLMQEYNKEMPDSFNHVFGLDVVPLVPPWRSPVGWQIRSSAMSALALNLTSGWQILNPSKWPELILHFHTGAGVIPAFLGFFQTCGANSDVGRKDVTMGLQRHGDGLDETTPYTLGKDVQVNIESPDDVLRSLKYGVLQFIGDVCLWSFWFAVGSYHHIKPILAAVGYVCAHIKDEVIQGLRAAFMVLSPGVPVVLVSTLVHQTMGATVFLGWLLVFLVFCYLPPFMYDAVKDAVQQARQKVLAWVSAWHALIRTWISAAARRISKPFPDSMRKMQIWKLFPGWMRKMRNHIIAVLVPVCSVGLICIELILAAPECLHQWWLMLVMLCLICTAWRSATSSRTFHAYPKQQ